MFTELYDDLKYQIRTGGFSVLVILICVAVFIIANIFNSFQNLSHSSNLIGENIFLKYISLSQDVMFNIKHFWVWITHLFTHVSFFHLLFNMINLYWFGMIVEDLIGQKHFKLLFFLSGIFGGIFFLISTLIFPWYQGQTVIAYGASSAIMGLIFAATAISPNYNLRLILFGNVSIKYIALVLIILDLLFIGQNDNTGGRAAHIGGAIFGFIYILLLRQGFDLTTIFKFHKRSKIKTIKNISNDSSSSSFNIVPLKKKSEFNLDQLLEKIKAKGIQSLSQEEKTFLDQQSNQ